MSTDGVFNAQITKKITIATLEYRYSIFITKLNPKRYRACQWIQWYGQRSELHLGDFSNFDSAFKFCRELSAKIEKTKKGGLGSETPETERSEGSDAPLT